MKIETKVTNVIDGDILIHGERLLPKVGKVSYSDMIFFQLLARHPTKAESRMFNAMLVCIIDHGAGTVSSIATRVVASGGVPLNTAIAGGILSQGDYHGGAIEGAMRVLEKAMEQEKAYTEEEIQKLAEEIVAEKLEKRQRLLGYGHRLRKKEDPRAQKLLEIAKEEGYESPRIKLALTLEKELEKQKGKFLPINADGVIAPILLEMGFTSDIGKAFFSIGRISGLVAQALEEYRTEKPASRRLSEDNITYTGPEEN